MLVRIECSGRGRRWKSLSVFDDWSRLREVHADLGLAGTLVGKESEAVEGVEGQERDPEVEGDAGESGEPGKVRLEKL